ncbi:MAG: ATP-binding protein [Planctomycetota bacterium]
MAPGDPVDELKVAQRRIRQLERSVNRYESFNRLHQAGQRALIESLERARAQALAAVDAKDQFLATMSHEFRTPMNGILGAIQLLGDAGNESEREDLMESIESSARSLLELLSDVLDFAKFGQSTMELQVIEFDLVGLMGSVMGGMAEQATLRKNVNVSLRCSADLASTVRGDVGCLRQALRILLSNAIKFTECGTVLVEVEPSPTRAGFVRFSVADTGVGIHPDHVERIFEPFTQVDASTTRRFGGSGLGLSIARRVINAMRGKLELESEQGVGSTFHFEIPLPAVDSQVPEPGAVRPQGASAPRPHSLRVLLVDDQPINLKIGEKFLGRFGAEVVTARNGEEALSRVAEGSFDLVLMDCTMPVMDGFEATKKIRRLDGAQASVPIVALTALAMPGDRERCLGAGMDGYLAKPIRREELGKTLQRFV